MQNTRDLILDAAEARMRQSGYTAVSFRDLADAVGIKSASVHHHFPTKGDLGAALAKRYRERFLARLGDPAAASPSGGVARLGALFAEAAESDAGMCLCGMFGAEIETMSEEAQEETRDFFRALARWLSLIPAERTITTAEALRVVSGLEGALLVARALGRPNLVPEMTQALVAAIGQGCA